MSRGVRAYATGQVTLAEGRTASVPPEVVQQLEPGEGVLISGGRA